MVFVKDFSLLDEFLLLQFVCQEVSGPCVQFCAIAFKLFFFFNKRICHCDQSFFLRKNWLRLNGLHVFQ